MMDMLFRSVSYCLLLETDKSILNVYRRIQTMEWLTDEILFYGGMIAAIGSAVAAAVYYIIACVRWARLSIRLDEEYGKIDCRKSNRDSELL